MDDDLLDIGEVARRSGLTASALRFYERKGLIEPAGRNGLRRTYEPGTLERLALITRARDAGFTLAEIAELFAAKPSDAELRERLRAQAANLEARITRLAFMRDSLLHASICLHDPLVECPDFRRFVRSAVPRT
ncbi:MerR family transcriptional regulator [Nonomuraea sp. NPDC050536]|uniref:MerR family transcriptional regulator n=1 Tax=Nonomuraea sp. NPDC050536 TaxID=3364366 RepID=UPI0037CBA6E7